jgi:transposase
MIAADLQNVQVWVATTPVDMRKSFDGLAEVVRSFLGHDPLSGSLFVFRNKGGHLLKVPWCDHDGYNPNIATAEKPPQPIEKGMPGPSLLAYVAVSKLGDYLPLYRLERLIGRQKVHIARGTMCAWMRCAAELMIPLVDLLAERVRASSVIHTDDTTVPIQSPGAASQQNGQCRKGRIWCYLGDEANPYNVYDDTPNRQRAGPAQWLQEYEGYLQADAYGGYDGIFHSRNVTEVACWAHARRKFYDAQDSDQEVCARPVNRRSLKFEKRSLPADPPKGTRTR